MKSRFVVVWGGNKDENGSLSLLLKKTWPITLNQNMKTKIYRPIGSWLWFFSQTIPMSGKRSKIDVLLVLCATSRVLLSNVLGGRKTVPCRSMQVEYTPGVSQSLASPISQLLLLVRWKSGPGSHFPLCSKSSIRQEAHLHPQTWPVHLGPLVGGPLISNGLPFIH